MADPKKNVSAFAQFVEEAKSQATETGLRGLCFDALDVARKENAGMNVERKFLTKFLLKVPTIQTHLNSTDLGRQEKYRRVNGYVGQWIESRKPTIVRKEKQGKFEVIKVIQF